MADEDVANKVLSKYPEYRDMVQPSLPNTGVSIGAQHDPGNPVSNYFRDVGTDLSQGGSRTGIGKALGFLQGRQNGYSGLNTRETSEGAANILGSPFTGTAQALEGLASIPQHPVAGPVKAVGGIAKALTLPGLFLGGPEATALTEAIPSAKYAGQQLNRIAEATGDSAVPLNNAKAPLQRLAELSERGGAGSVPAGVMQLLQRSQGIEPLAYPEARDFVSNISTH